MPKPQKFLAHWPGFRKWFHVFSAGLQRPTEETEVDKHFTRLKHDFWKSFSLLLDEAIYASNTAVGLTVLDGSSISNSPYSSVVSTNVGSTYRPCSKAVIAPQQISLYSLQQQGAV